MDGSRFDAWTRRRFGLLTAGGFSAALANLANAGEADANKSKDKNKNKNKKKRKKKHKKQPCLELGTMCGGKQTCCGQLRCARAGVVNQTDSCCQDVDGAPCRSHFECCHPFVCNLLAEPPRCEAP
jgi:hypothetical protein